MFKKVLISAIIATVVFAAGSVVYAQSEKSYTSYTRYGRDTDPVFELLSDKEESKTFSREYVISGNAEEGTEVTIDLFWFRTEDEKSIIAKKKSLEDSQTEGNWIFQQTEGLTVGASGIFAESVALNLGRNRIILYIRDKSGNTTERTLEIERFWEKQASEEVSGSTINKFVEDISNSINIDK